MQEARDQADSRLRGLSRGQPEDRGGPLRAQPPHAARAERCRVSQPRQADERRLPRGVQARQGERRPRAAPAPFGGRHRAHRLPPVPLLPAADRRQPGRGAQARGRPRPDIRPGQRLLRGPEERPGRAGQGQRRDREDRPGDGWPPGRHGRRPLPPARGLPPPLGAPLRADQVHALAAEAQLRHQRVFPEGHRGDGRRLRSVARGDPQHARDRRPLQRRDRARPPADPALHDARGQERGRVPARAGVRGGPRALRRPAPGRGRRAARDGARGHREDGLLRLLPDRLGLRQVREGLGHLGRARAVARRPARWSPTR